MVRSAVPKTFEEKVSEELDGYLGGDFSMFEKLEAGFMRKHLLTVAGGLEFYADKIITRGFKGWFDETDKHGRTVRRIILLGESHDGILHLGEHVAMRHATRIWEKNLHLSMVFKERTKKALHPDRVATIEKFIGKGINDNDIVDVDTDESTMFLNQAIGDDLLLIDSRYMRSLGGGVARILAADTEIFVEIQKWIGKKSYPMSNMGAKARKLRYLSVLVGAAHYPGIAHYLETFTAFAPVKRVIPLGHFLGVR